MELMTTAIFMATDLEKKTLFNADDWVRCNNIWSNGYTINDDVVDGFGVATTGVWKWINLSEYGADESGVIFRVELEGLTQIFQVGAREDGLDMDKFAFARADYYYTVVNLNNGEPGSPDPPLPEVEGPPLAEGKCKFLGCGFDNSQSPNFGHYWNQVTPGNAGKWGWVEGIRDAMSWGDLDEAYNLAQDSGYYFKHHVLIWGNQQPAWIASLDVTEQRDEIEEWFSEVAARYDNIDMIEVVNEPLHDPPDDPEDGGYIEALGGTGTTGWDWVLEAFRIARAAFPGVDLMINEYGIVNSTSNTNSYIDVIELLQAEDLIDAIGIQAHAFSTSGASASSITGSLNSLAATGLPVYVTEMDVDGPTDEVQLAEYQRIFPLFWKHSAVKGISLSGFRIGMWRTEQGAYLINEDGTERPALTWLRDYIAETEFDENCLFITSLSDEPEYTVTVFPNPSTNGCFTISGIENYSTLRVLDGNGHQLIEKNLRNQTSVEVRLDVSPGIYIIQLIDGQKSLYKKISIN